MPDQESPGLLGVGHADLQELKVSEELAWLPGRLGKFVKGGIYLIAGQPGIGK